MTPEQAGWAILTGAVIFGGELAVWFQDCLDRARRRFVRDVRRELRSCHVSGGFGEAGGPTPLSLPVSAGVEPPSAVQAPPAPCHLVGAARHQPAAPARPPRVAVHG